MNFFQIPLHHAYFVEIAGSRIFQYAQIAYFSSKKVLESNVTLPFIMAVWIETDLIKRHNFSGKDYLP